MSKKEQAKALEKTLRSTKNKTILHTKFSQPSGLGTDMHSRPGKGTITLYKAFQPKTENNAGPKPVFLSKFEKQSQQSQQMKVLQALSLVEADVRREGLKVDLEEIKKISMAQLAANGVQFGLDDQIKIEEEKPKDGAGDDGRKSADSDGGAMASFDLTQGPIQAKKGQQQTFNSIMREHPKLLREYMGGENLAPPSTHYNPHPSKFWKNISQKVQFKHAETTPREKVTHLPECMLVEPEPQCTFISRKLLREVKQDQNLKSGDISRNPELKEKVVEDLQQKDYRIKMLNTDSISSKVLPAQGFRKIKEDINPPTLCYSHKKEPSQKLSMGNFTLQTSRPSDILLKSPFPGDRRFQVRDVHENTFDLPPIKSDVRGHNKRIVQHPIFDKQMPRDKHGGNKLEVPDSNAYQTEDLHKAKTQSLEPGAGLGSLEFHRRPDKQFHAPDKSFKIPESYGLSSLEKGYNAISSGKKVKGQVALKNQVARDDKMYSFKRDELTEMQRRITKMLQSQSSARKESEKLNMGEYIPNSLCRQMGSTISLYSTKFGTTQDASDYKQKKSIFSAPGHSDRKVSDQISQRDLGNIVFNYNFDNKTDGIMEIAKNKIKAMSPRTVQEMHTPIKIYGGEKANTLISDILNQVTTGRTQSIEAKEENGVLSAGHKDSSAKIRQGSVRLGSTFGSLEDISALSFNEHQQRENQEVRNRIRIEKQMAQNSTVTQLNGTFLQFDQTQSRLVDMSRRHIQEPHKLITGEDNQHGDNFLITSAPNYQDAREKPATQLMRGPGVDPLSTKGSSMRSQPQIY